MGWEPGKFATLRLTDLGEVAVAEIVDRVFSQVLGRASGFKVSVELFEAA